MFEWFLCRVNICILSVRKLSLFGDILSRIHSYHERIYSELIHLCMCYLVLAMVFALKQHVY
jgi:hypothetical protein